MRHDYDNGQAFGQGYAAAFGPHAASRAIVLLGRRERNGNADYLAGMCDAVLDHVQNRELLTPGCYRVRAAKGAE